MYAVYHLPFNRREGQIYPSLDEANKALIRPDGLPAILIDENGKDAGSNLARPLAAAANGRRFDLADPAQEEEFRAVLEAAEKFYNWDGIRQLIEPSLEAFASGDTRRIEESIAWIIQAGRELSDDERKPIMDALCNLINRKDIELDRMRLLAALALNLDERAPAIGQEIYRQYRQIDGLYWAAEAIRLNREQAYGHARNPRIEAQAEALGAMLMQALDDKGRRGTIIHALGSIQHRPAISKLFSIIADENASINERNAAIDALEAMGECKCIRRGHSANDWKEATSYALSRAFFLIPHLLNICGISIAQAAAMKGVSAQAIRNRLSRDGWKFIYREGIPPRDTIYLDYLEVLAWEPRRYPRIGGRKS